MNIKLKYGRKLNIAVGKSRHDTKWKNVDTSWEKLVSKLSETYRTYETVATYASWKKDKQDDVKDIGGFVGGTLKEGRRKNGYVESRCIVSLDLDFAYPEFMEDFKISCDFAMCVYSTHKHKTRNPRLRLLIPLDRDVTSDEYEAIARKIASDYDMDLFDDTTYQPTRLMYWPSTSKDGDFYFDYVDAPLIKADEVLARYPDWRDSSYWPESSRVKETRKSTVDKQGDPLLKEGLIGSFCRTYTIQEAISEFLSDVYTECDIPNRYTFTGGSTAAGLVIYDDKFAYSNHGTDPASGLLCNAFDLVRIHKFKELDKNCKDYVKPSEMPSWKAMMDFVASDSRTRETIGSDAIEKAYAEFSSIINQSAVDGEEVITKDDIDISWTKNLEVNKRGEYESTIDNLVLILKNDTLLHGLGHLNLFNGRKEVIKTLPWKRESAVWSDNDDAALRHYVEKVYSISARGNLADAVSIVFAENAVHPVKRYLDSLEWDGIKRLDTLIIDYIGADDTLTNREITRKTLVAAVSRIFRPGCQFDYMLTLVGAQGIGKSTLFQKLAKDWFQDTLPDIRGKEAYEALDGRWIVEMAELKSLKKSDVETIKAFLTKREDTYRKAYDRNVTVNKRQCIFVGSTNEAVFLNDPTGNRRFWPIEVDASKRKYNIWEQLNAKEIDQVWAEAVAVFKSGEENIMALSKNTYREMQSVQEEHTEDNSYRGVVQAYLEMHIPGDWYSRSIQEQITWVNATEDYRKELSTTSTVARDRVCALEIWCVAFQKDKASFTQTISRQLNTCLDNIKGWTKCTTSRFGGYGTQRGYIRRILK